MVFVSRKVPHSSERMSLANFWWQQHYFILCRLVWSFSVSLKKIKDQDCYETYHCYCFMYICETYHCYCFMYTCETYYSYCFMYISLLIDFTVRMQQQCGLLHMRSPQREFLLFFIEYYEGTLGPLMAAFGLAVSSANFCLLSSIGLSTNLYFSSFDYTFCQIFLSAFAKLWLLGEIIFCDLQLQARSQSRCLVEKLRESMKSCKLLLDGEELWDKWWL